MKRMLALALGGSLVLAVLLLLLWTGQRRMIYFPQAQVPTPAEISLADVETFTFEAADGVTLHGWLLRSTLSRARFTVIVFNGNAGNRAYRAALGEALRASGCSVLLFDYRGFGESGGTPTEAGLAADARAARAFLVTRNDVDPDRLVYFGESLGTAVATRLAAEHTPAALILRSPFASLAEVGQFHYPMLPVQWLLRDRFASIDYIQQVRSPLLVIAGARDAIVPVEQSRRLYDAAPSTKRLLVIEDADHNDHELNAGDEMMRAVREFLAQIV
jgi:uncharacterized protein